MYFKKNTVHALHRHEIQRILQCSTDILALFIIAMIIILYIYCTLFHFNYSSCLLRLRCLKLSPFSCFRTKCTYGVIWVLLMYIA